MSATLGELLDKLEKLSGPDREVDYALSEFAMPFLNDYRRLDGDNGWYSDTPKIEGANHIAAASPYTDSIDWALNLVEHLSPGAEYEMTNIYGVAHVTLPLNTSDAIGPSSGRHKGGNLPIAICIALLRSLETHHEQ